MSDVYNLSQIEYEDGCVEYTWFSKPINGCSKKKNNIKTPAGCSRLPVPEKTPFGYALFEMCSEEELARRSARSREESVKRAKRNVEIIGRCNHWDYFATLTFNDDLCPLAAFSYEVASSYIHKWLDALKHRYSDIQWLLVLERGSKNGRWHAHALLAGAELRLEDSGHTTNGKTHDIIYNMPLEYSYGFTTVTRVRSSAAAGRYISKYIGKSLGDVPSGAKRYWSSRGLKRLKDVRVTYLFDRSEMADLVSYFSEIADRVHRVCVQSIDMFVTYFTVYAPPDWSGAGCPT